MNEHDDFDDWTEMLESPLLNDAVDEPPEGGVRGRNALRHLEALREERELAALLTEPWSSPPRRRRRRPRRAAGA